MNRTVNRLLALSFVAGCTSACGAGGTSFSGALPSRSTVQINVPQQSGQALALGEQSEFMAKSKDLADGINGGVGWVFDLLEKIVEMPATEQDEAHAVWGPSEPKGLERLSYRFTVTKVGENDFTYALDARLKGETDDAAFVTFLSGTAQPGDEDNKGTGTMTVNAGARRGLLNEEGDCQNGTIEVAYDVTAEPRSLQVDFVEWLDTCDADARAANATYTYTETADGAGTLDFDVIANMHKAEEAKPLEETMAIRTRWMADGQGRADVRISGGEVPGDLATHIPDTTETSVLVTECWDDLFALTFSDTTPDELEDTFHEPLGDESACVFAEASAPDA